MKDRDKARTFGQDLMRGENGKFNKPNVGTRQAGRQAGRGLDIVSEKILKGGARKKNLVMPHTSASASAMGLAGGFDESATGQSGTSIFDPTLCELFYRWFTPPKGHVLDPFAGGSVRGIVAAVLGRKYTGIDLRPEQIEANRIQAKRIIPKNQPKWIVGDSRDVGKLAPGQYDAIFSCPPYADLERYSDDPLDLSTMKYPEFLKVYRHIIAESCALLKPDRFACFVVGDIRDEKGNYRNFVSDTISAFQDAGLKLYNEAILVTAVGSLSIRVGRQFKAGRKLGKTHQNVIVMLKGDGKKATAACGPVDVTVPDELII